jgi:hypothetical protein
MGAGLWLIIPFPHQVEVSFLKDGVPPQAKK